MYLYEVVQWGNDSDDPVTGGPNGPDTCCLVRAATPEEADSVTVRHRNHALVLFKMKLPPSKAGIIYLLGEDMSSQSDPKVLRGPYVTPAYAHGWRSWRRDDDGAWVEQIGS
jgi:hypothetical protein